MAEREYCAWCGSGEKRKVNRVVVPPGETYTGNEKVIGRSRVLYTTSTETDCYSTWDGESYEPFKFWPFCKVRCAQAFARAAYDHGLRVVKKD